MSKKKNTLKDLDEFLRQQATTLVPIEGLPVKETTAKENVPTPPASVMVSPQQPALKDFLSTLPAQQNFRTELYDAIIALFENQKELLPEDRMLINTALYLRHGSHWKTAIQQYWKKS